MHISCVCPARQTAKLCPAVVAIAATVRRSSKSEGGQSVSPRPTAYRTEYTDDTPSAPSSGNARAPSHGRPNGRSPAAGSSWPVSFSSAPPSHFQAPFFQQPFFQQPWLPARQWTLSQAQSRRSARPAPARRRPAGTTRAAADAATTRRDSFCMGSSGSGQLRFRPDPITSAAVRTPGFWRHGRPWPGCACPGCRS